ncbi:hypothetical protein EDB92DRAFT_1815809 [Lactarius akahatsu]|uniref:Peptidase M24 domain-containing protein n=1 Tax=Lactarius akahatsu TaxID=416441 RepID=A0AAD4QE45_9AGAM|nr:hypothetical protein EDB92DRAFT_1815809 [Lactarius akahatsu]
MPVRSWWQSPTRPHGCAAPTLTSIPSPMAAVITDNVILSVDLERVSQDVRAQLGQVVQLRDASGRRIYPLPQGARYRPPKVLVGDKTPAQLPRGLGFPTSTPRARPSRSSRPTDNWRSSARLVAHDYLFYWFQWSWMAKTLTRLALGILERSRRRMDEEVLLAGRSSANLFLMEDNTKGTNYRHGTGHGVGHFLNLNVHKGAVGTSCSVQQPVHPVKAGYDSFKRAEPGYYAEEECGIRIENVVNVREAQTPNNFGDKGISSFEHVTVLWFVSPCLLPVYGRRTDMDS